MKVFLYVLVFLYFTGLSDSSPLGIPNPLDIAKGVAGEVDNQAKHIAEGVSKQVQNVGNATKVVDEKLTNGTRTIFGKVHSGVFDIEKGFVNGVDEVIGTPVDIKEVTFFLADSKNVENPLKIDYYTPDIIQQTKGKIYFLIHGWMSSKNTTWYHDLSKIFTEANPENQVIQVDWARPAGENYAFAAFNTESVGNLLGILINRLVTEYKIPKENIILIGHSLGGQSAGWAGKKFQELTGKTLPRIIALDPAGPLFILRPNQRRLNKHDAGVVMVIHTDGGKLGFPSATGTIDFFPNGGSDQPGCWKVDLAKISTYIEPVTCDHSRAWDFFVEAVNNTGSFPARKCDSFGDFKKNKCDTKPVVCMGDLETEAVGSFYLETNSEKPYSKSLDKAAEQSNEGAENIKEDIEKIQQKFPPQKDRQEVPVTPDNSTHAPIAKNINER